MDRRPDPDPTYAARHPGWHAEDGPHKAREVADLVASLAWPHRTVEDAGCGSGAVAAALARRWSDSTVVAWDPSPEADANHVPHPRVTRAAEAPATSPDLVLALDVLEHLDAPWSWLEGLLARCPRAILRVPLDLAAVDLLRPVRWTAHLDRYDHVHAWSRALVRRGVRRAGGRVVAERYVRIPPPPPRSPAGRVAEFARKRAVQAGHHGTLRIIGGVSLLLATVRASG